MLCHSLWSAEFLLKNQQITLSGFPCMLFVAFPLLILVSFLSFIFVCLINTCLRMFLLGLSCMERCTSRIWVNVSFLVREVFGYNLFKYFLRPSSSLFAFWVFINSDFRTENHCFSIYAHAIIVLPFTLLPVTAPKPSHQLTQFCHVVTFKETSDIKKQVLKFLFVQPSLSLPQFFFQILQMNYRRPRDICWAPCTVPINSFYGGIHFFPNPPPSWSNHHCFLSRPAELV